MGFISTVLDWIGLSPRDVGLTVIGGILVGLFPYMLKAAKETYELGRAKLKGNKEEIASELEQTKAAYKELVEKFAEAIKNKQLPSAVRIVRDPKGVVRRTDLVYEEAAVIEEQEAYEDDVYQEPESEERLVETHPPVVQEVTVGTPRRRLSSPPPLPKK